MPFLARPLLYFSRSARELVLMSLTYPPWEGAGTDVLLRVIHCAADFSFTLLPLFSNRLSFVSNVLTQFSFPTPPGVRVVI